MAGVVIRNLFPQFRDKLGALRPWPNNAHIATNHVVNLRQFVKPGVPDESANPGYPAVVGGCPLGLAVFFGVLAHRSEEHTSELQSRPHLVCRLLLEKKK